MMDYTRCAAEVDTAHSWFTYRCRRPSKVVVGSEWGGIPLCTQHRNKAARRGVSIKIDDVRHWLNGGDHVQLETKGV